MSRKIVLLAGLLVAGFQSFSQVLTGEAAAARYPQAEKVRIDPASNSLQYIKLKPAVKISPAGFPAWLRETLNQTTATEWRLVNTLADQLGFEHLRFQQYHHNLPVTGKVFIAHVKNGLVMSCNGESAAMPAANPQVTLNSKQAFSAALQLVGASSYMWESPAEEQELKTITNNLNATYFPTPQLVYAPVSGRFDEDDFIPAYKVDVYASDPMERSNVFLSATTGKLLFKENRIHTADSTGTALTKFSGTKTIKTQFTNGNYRLQESRNSVTIHTRNLQRGTSSGAAVNFTDEDNIWDNRNSFKDEVATDAHWGAEVTYDYFLTKHARNSYNNFGSGMMSYVHFGTKFNNAFWNGISMTYGDGDGVFMGPLTDLDIVGHEFAHGVTEYSADLVYAYEPGALNESFSDIFGVSIDFYSRPGLANYLMGENVMVGGGAFRSMQNPNQFNDPDTYGGRYWKTGPDDNGGVHSNSGVQNFWYYLLVNGGSGTNDIGSSYNVNGIGMAAAEKIAYRNLTVYLSQSSNYADAAFYSLMAAEDLFGACSPHVIATGDAWYAVGVGNPYLMASSFNADNAYFCNFPATVSFENKSINATSYLWDFGDGNTSTQTNPSHTYTAPGNYTVKLKTFTSPAICGVTADSVVKTAYIKVLAGAQAVTACQPATTTSPTAGMGIKRVRFANLDRSSGDATEGNKDFSCNQPANLISGNVYELTIETGPPPAQRSKVWIDYNNDGSFDPVTELIATSSVYILSTSFMIRTPLNVVLNTPIRMRVSADASTNTNITACGTLQKGQFEDYSVIFTSQVRQPEAAFKANQTSIVPGYGTYFTDMSNFQPTSWQWFFDGGSPATSTLQNPTGIMYPSSGTYSVRLIVSNALGSDTLTKGAYIRVGNGITATQEELNNFKSLNIYPNPASNSVKIQYGFSGKRQVVITLLNALGQEILSQTKTATDNLETELDVTGTAAGIYMVRIANGNSQTTRKLVIQK